jgi:hypothetical protein
MNIFTRKVRALVALIILWQVSMVACWTFVDKTTAHNLFLRAVVIASWLVPLIGYTVAVYDTSLLAKWPRALRAVFFVPFSLVFAFGIYLVLGLAVDFASNLTYH